MIAATHRRTTVACAVVIVLLLLYFATYETGDIPFQSILAPQRRPQKIHLVTFGHNEPFETNGRNIVKQVLQHTYADTARFWSMQDMKTEFPEHASIWDYIKPDTPFKRPGCMAQKAALVLEVMVNRSQPGDWIFWTDSSKHYATFNVNLTAFVAHLETKLGLDQYPGTALCHLVNTDNSCGVLVQPAVFRAMDLDEPRYWFAPHYQNNFFGFKNTPRNQAFVREWKKYNLDMNVACSSHPNDQSIFSVLVAKYEMKAPYLCDGSKQWKSPDSHTLKNPEYVVNAIMSDAKKPVWDAFEITRNLVKAGWFSSRSHN